MKYLSLRHEVLATARRMNETGLNQGTSGNVSVRVPDGFVITPTGMPYESCHPEDLVEVRPDGRVPSGQRRPSTEWHFHCDIYATRPDVSAIVHAHPMFGTTLACLRRGIPAFHYMIAVAGGRDVRCAPYATFGTPELSAFAVEALRDRKACLLANHGMISVGSSLTDAFKVAREVETLAAQYWRALQVGEPYVLDDAEMDRVLEKFRTYGHQPKAPRF
jgi:L-fuculose-phosphate aldolase